MTCKQINDDIEGFREEELLLLIVLYELIDENSPRSPEKLVDLGLSYSGTSRVPFSM